MFRRLLVPIDGWPASDRAVSVALGMAKALDAHVVFCHVLQPSDAAQGETGAGIAGETMLAVAMSKAEMAGISARSELLSGNPTAVILHAAERIAADLIVIGTSGRTGLERVVLGSVSQAVVRGSRAPVVVVRADTEVPGE